MPSPRLLLPAGLAAATLLAVPSPASAQTPSTTGGRAAVADAYTIDVDARALDGTVPVRVTASRATQQCPPATKAPVTDTVLDLGPVPPPNGELVHNAETLRSTASTDCAEPRAVAEAETQNLELLFQGGQSLITADVIKSVSATSCTGAPSAEGSLFVNLKVGSFVVPANPAPNTKIDLGLITVIVNEQQIAEGGRGMVVNGLHVIGNTPLLQGDIIVSHARSGVSCGSRAAGGAGGGSAGSAATDTKNDDFALTMTPAPATVRPGQTVTYTATLQNKSEDDCLVNKFIAHLPAPFQLVSSKGALGEKVVGETRADNGVDAVLRPDDVTIEAGKSVTQTFVVTVPAGTPDGTYSTSLELLCASMGNYVAGPFAPVTVRSAAVLGVRTAVTPVVTPVPSSLPRTGAPVAALALLGIGTLAGGVVLHRQGALRALVE